MSVYSVKSKGWRYDFTHKGIRHTEAWFKTKKEAKQAEARKREEIKNPPSVEDVQTDMDFLELINHRLDHVKAYNSECHYQEHIYMARKWVKNWGQLICEQITPQLVSKFIIKRSKVSNFVANKEIRYLRATFNFGIRKNFITCNPAKDVDFFPVEKRVKYVPPSEDIDKVINLAAPDTQDYLWTIRESMARVSEINRLTWDDVNLQTKFIILYTRKKKGGHFTPRKVPMTENLFNILFRRFANRDTSKQWVFWHRYFSRKKGEWVEGPFQDRKGIMKSLCNKAGVRYFRYHALRHSGASIMENNNVSIGTIQRILGHENRSTTEIYLHSIGNVEREALAIYEQARQKSHTKSHTKQKSA